MPLALHAYASPRALRARIMHATVPYPYRIRVYVRTSVRDLYALISIKYVRVVHTRARAEWFAHTVAISQLLLFLKKRQVIFFFKRLVMAEAEDSPSSPKRRKTEELAGPSRKYGGGGAIYKSRFQVSWQKKWPCVKPVKNDPHHFECTVCSEQVSC